MTDTAARVINEFAGLFFMAGGAFADLLLIRSFLTVAYLFLVAFQFAIDDARRKNRRFLR